MAVWLSLKIACMATLLAVAVAVPMAFLNARRAYVGRGVVEGLIILPLVLPPTVIGYLIIVVLGSRGWIGQHLRAWFDYTLLFRIEAAILAATLVALPLIYLPARAAFTSVEREMEDIARLHGANLLQVFWYVSLPIAFRGVLSGLMLAFARALGEFGATAMVFGMREGRTTLPIEVYLSYEQGEMGDAWPPLLILTAISIVITVLYNRSTFAVRR